MVSRESRSFATVSPKSFSNRSGVKPISSPEMIDTNRMPVPVLESRLILKIASSGFASASATGGVRSTA